LVIYIIDSPNRMSQLSKNGLKINMKVCSLKVKVFKKGLTLKNHKNQILCQQQVHFITPTYTDISSAYKYI